jgi:hypothetical protein
MYSARYFCMDLMKSGFSRQIFIKTHNMKLYENPYDIGNCHFFIFMRTRLINGILKFYIPTGPASVTPAYTIFLELLFKRHLEIVS